MDFGRDHSDILFRTQLRLSSALLKTVALKLHGRDIAYWFKQEVNDVLYARLATQGYTESELEDLEELMKDQLPSQNGYYPPLINYFRKPRDLPGLSERQQEAMLAIAQNLPAILEAQLDVLGTEQAMITYLRRKYANKFNAILHQALQVARQKQVCKAIHLQLFLEFRLDKYLFEVDMEAQTNQICGERLYREIADGVKAFKGLLVRLDLAVDIKALLIKSNPPTPDALFEALHADKQKFQGIKTVERPLANFADCPAGHIIQKFLTLLLDRFRIEVNDDNEVCLVSLLPPLEES